MNIPTWQPWDDSMKRLVSEHPQDFVSWLLKGAKFIGFKSIELKNTTRKADMLLDTILDGEEILVNLEVQSTEDPTMALRLLEYNILATKTHGYKILPCVLFLRPCENIPVSPLEWRLPNGQAILIFYFVVLKLWDMTAQELIQTGFVGLLPLLPLTKDGKQYHTVERMINEIVASRQLDLLSLSSIFAGLVFTATIDREWITRRFTMHKDILEESWVYQEILQRGLEKGIEKGLSQGIEQGEEKARLQAIEIQRQTLLTIVQRRFPTLATWAQHQLNTVTDQALLQELNIRISLARDLEEVSTVLSAINPATPHA